MRHLQAATRSVAARTPSPRERARGEGTDPRPHSRYPPAHNIAPRPGPPTHASSFRPGDGPDDSKRGGRPEDPGRHPAPVRVRAARGAVEDRGPLHGDAAVGPGVHRALRDRGPGPLSHRLARRQDHRDRGPVARQRSGVPRRHAGGRHRRQGQRRGESLGPEGPSAHPRPALHGRGLVRRTDRPHAGQRPGQGAVREDRPLPLFDRFRFRSRRREGHLRDGLRRPERPPPDFPSLSRDESGRARRARSSSRATSSDSRRSG